MSTVIIILLILYLSFLLITIYHILDTHRDPVGAVAWIFSVIIFPFGGMIIYFFFGWTRFHRKVARYKKSGKIINQIFLQTDKKNSKENIDNTVRIYKKVIKSHFLLDSLNQNIPTYGNDVNFLLGGDEAYMAMLDEIRKAESNICMQYYIFSDDNIGREFSDALKKKQAEGVQVRILYDPIGSIKTKKKFWNDLRRAGIKVYSFGSLNLLKRKFRINFRCHRKNLIIDGKTAFCGGINIYDQNIKKYCPQKKNQIRDYHFIIRGPAVQDFQAVFSDDWFFITGEKLNGNEFFKQNPAVGENIIRVINSGPANNHRVFSFELLGAIMHAEKKIKIITPYFYPEPEILSALKYASLAGLEVSIIIPKKNEHKIVEYASQSLYQELLECSINIYERKPPFIHTKSFIIDDEWAILGSGNLDYISLRLNYELCFEVIGGSIIKKLTEMFEIEKNHSIKISQLHILKYGKFRILRNNFCALFAPIL